MVLDLCRKHGMSSATYYAWKAKYGGLEVSEAKWLRSLEEENGKLKRLLADAMLDNAGLKDLLSKNGGARRQARSGRASAGSPEGGLSGRSRPSLTATRRLAAVLLSSQIPQ